MLGSSSFAVPPIILAYGRLRNGQRTGKPCVHYKVKWAGAQWEGHDTWEPLENLQAPRVKAMVSEYNKNKRVARA